MKLNEPYLIVNLNDNNIIFFVISFNDERDFKVIKKIILESESIQNGRIIDIENISKLLKENINTIEEEINYFF